LLNSHGDDLKGRLRYLLVIFTIYFYILHSIMSTSLLLNVIYFVCRISNKYISDKQMPRIHSYTPIFLNKINMLLTRFYLYFLLILSRCSHRTKATYRVAVPLYRLSPPG
jgi:hypothetical protein